MKKQLLTAILICGASVLTSYSNDDKPTGQQDEYAGVPLIILDTDIGSSADDLFALEMLYHYEDEGRCRLLGVMVDREGERNAAFADVSWTDAHPIKQVYMQCDCNTGQRMWDVMPVIQAVEGHALFSLSERGTVTLTDKAETIFTPSATGTFRYQLPGFKTWAAQMLEKIRKANKQR